MNITDLILTKAKKFLNKNSIIALGVLIFTFSISVTALSFSTTANSKRTTTPDLLLVSYDLLQEYEPNNYKDFNQANIGDLFVYWQQQIVPGIRYTAIVEKAQKVYQFDSSTGQLFKKIDTFNHNLPKILPKSLISKETAESITKGDVQYSNLYYISRESDVFPVDTTNPVWVVKSSDENAKIIDAITGKILGNAVLPPADAYSFSGPINEGPCSGTWTNWYQSAKAGFEALGYNTYTDVWPAKSTIQSYVQDNDLKLFYEVAHGSQWGFYGSCNGGSFEATYASDIKDWISGYNKKDFTFLANCNGMCDTGVGMLSYEFRKGSVEDTTTVGYCGMSTEPCSSSCWGGGYSVQWQNALFGYMEDKETVYQAFQYANADYPGCGSSQCMRFAGDENFTVDVSFEPGHVCDSGDDCASGYCEGSVNNPARCGINEPTIDAWAGGGNTSGCGVDDSSEFQDYYFDINGNENYEITDTFNCDIDDDCGDNCPELGERTDYYVEEDTNTCLFTTFDADDDETSCTDCMNNNYWDLGGDIGQCCSDDANENILTRVCDPGSCDSDPSDDACCSLDNKCVYNSQCYGNGYKGDVDEDGKEEECTAGIWIEEEENFIPLPISPGVDGQVVDPSNNGYLDRFSDLWFVWSRIDEATEYQVSIAYDGDLEGGPYDEMDPIPYEILPRDLLMQPISGNPRIRIPARQITKQAMGAYRWKLAAKVDGVWYGDKVSGSGVWYSFVLDMIPEITTPNAVISKTGDRLLSWDLTKHKLAAEGIPSDNKPEYIIFRLRGTTPGTLCEFSENAYLPTYCYIQYPYKTNKNYFEFDGRNFDSGDEFYVPAGNYEWSITFLEGEFSWIEAAELKQKKQLKFGPIENFTVTAT